MLDVSCGGGLLVTLQPLAKVDDRR